MKKRAIFLVFIVVVILILSIFVYAQVSEDEDDKPDNKLPGSTDEVKDQLKAGAKNVSGAIGTKINEKTTQLIELPDELQLVAKVLFGMQANEKIQLNIFMILIAVWLMFFIIIYKISELMPFFGSSSKLLILIFAVIVTALVGFTGALKTVALEIYGFAELFKFLEKIPALATAVAIVIVFLIMWAARLSTKIIKKKISGEKADVEGTEAGYGIKTLRSLWKVFTRGE